MASFPGADLSAQPEILREATSRLQTEYDYRFHRSGQIHLSPFGEAISPELAAWYGVAGPPDVVTDRLVALTELGIAHFHLSLRGEEREWAADAVMPAVRSAAAGR
jgi:hypothetical protein